MINSRWERITGVAGILGTALLMSSFFLPGNQLHGDESAGVVAKTLAGNRAGVLASIELQVASILLFFVFVTGLRVVLRRAEGERSNLSPLAFGAGLLAATMVLVDNGILAGITASVVRQLQQSDANLIWAFYQTYKAVGYAIDPMLGVFVLTSSLILLRAATFPRWVSAVGFLFGALLVLAAFAVTSWAANDWTALFSTCGFFGMLGFAIWTLSTSIYLLVKGTAIETRVTRPATAHG